MPGKSLPQDWSDSIRMTITIERAVLGCAKCDRQDMWRFPLVALRWCRSGEPVDTSANIPSRMKLKKPRMRQMNWSTEEWKKRRRRKKTVCGDRRHGGIAITCSAWQDKCFANNKLFYSQDKSRRRSQPHRFLDTSTGNCCHRAQRERDTICVFTVCAFQVSTK